MPRTLLVGLLLTVAACGTDHALSPRVSRVAPEAGTTIVPVQWYLPATLPLARGWVSGAARGINTSGVVVGALGNSSGGSVAARWTGGSVSLLVAAPGYASASASAINDAGVIVGSSRNASLSSFNATRWNATSVIALADLGYASDAHDVNASGTIVGSVRTSALDPKPASWDSTGTMSLLPLPSGYHYGEAVAINASGVAVGFVYSTGSDKRAYLWNAAGGSFIGSVFGGSSRATDINDAGKVLVYGGTEPSISSGTTSPPYTTVNIVWSGNATGISSKGRIIGHDDYTQGKTWLSTPWPLAWPADGTAGMLRAVNTCGTIVGQVTTATGDRPAIWTKGACDP